MEFLVSFERILEGNTFSVFQDKPKCSVEENNASDTFLSDAIVQFAHDKFSGNNNAVFSRQYSDLLEKRAANSFKFKLFLYAVNHLQRLETLTNHEERVVKLCLSRVVDLLNKDFTLIFSDISGASTMTKIIEVSKKVLPLSNHLDETSRNILNKIGTLPDELSILSMLNAEKLK